MAADKMHEANYVGNEGYFTPPQLAEFAKKTTGNSSNLLMPAMAQQTVGDVTDVHDVEFKIDDDLFNKLDKVDHDVAPSSPSSNVELILLSTR